MKDHAAEATTIAITSQITKVSGITTVVAWLANTGYVAVLGLCIAAAGLATNIYFQWRRDRRERLLYERQMWLMKTNPGLVEDNDETH